MKRQSAKARKVAAERRKIAESVADLHDHPICEAGRKIEKSVGHRGICDGFAIEFHEPLMRSRGGDPTDPGNMIAVCRSCHDWIHRYPAAATELGLLKRADPDAEG